MTLVSSGKLFQWSEESWGPWGTDGAQASRQGTCCSDSHGSAAHLELPGV